jgi:hypothetical protein
VPIAGGKREQGGVSGGEKCAGTPSRGLVFRHADGTPYGGAPDPASAELRAKAYRALVRMGFRESEAKRALVKIPASLSQRHGVEAAALEELLRAALRELAPSR